MIRKIGRNLAIIGPLLVIITFFVPSQLYAGITTLSIAKMLVKHNISQSDNANTEVGQKICRLSGRPSYECSSATTLGTST
jgi:hypothetical protein